MTIINHMNTWIYQGVPVREVGAAISASCTSKLASIASTSIDAFTQSITTSSVRASNAINPSEDASG